MSLILHKRLTAYQTQFHRRWNDLHDPHLRALAWLLSAPNLLDAQAAQWHSAIAQLESHDAGLRALNAVALRALLAVQPTARLGRYAEKLLGFYLQQQGRLFASNIQIRSKTHATVGEFDFLLHDASGTALIHWEFATKFYLLASECALPQCDDLVGPNLLDTLGAKIHKIMAHQLQLARHPAAAAYLPLPVVHAAALLKGWLFYRDPMAPAAVGVASDHCRGFWCTASVLAADVAYADLRYAILPRLQWLAPARLAACDTVSGAVLQQMLQAHFMIDRTPLLLAVMSPDGDLALECSRGFVVPDGWCEQAAERVRQLDVEPGR